MKKIMFNDQYGLTEAVLSGQKTQTRRITPQSVIEKVEKFGREYFAGTLDSLTGIDLFNHYFFTEQIGRLPFSVGEVVAIAQSYKDAGVNSIPCEDDEFGCYGFPAEQTTGWTNKMFVRADLMPHNIRITNVRVERLQDISDEDCIAEGIYELPEEECFVPHSAYSFVGNPGVTFGFPKGAYENLIDKVSGKGTWKSNSYVFVYDFELVK